MTRSRLTASRALGVIVKRLRAATTRKTAAVVRRCRTTTRATACLEIGIDAFKTIALPVTFLTFLLYLAALSAVRANEERLASLFEHFDKGVFPRWMGN